MLDQTHPFPTSIKLDSQEQWQKNPEEDCKHKLLTQPQLSLNSSRRKGGKEKKKKKVSSEDTKSLAHTPVDQGTNSVSVLLKSPKLEFFKKSVLSCAFKYSREETGRGNSWNMNGRILTSFELGNLSVWEYLKFIIMKSFKIFRLKLIVLAGIQQNPTQNLSWCDHSELYTQIKFQGRLTHNTKWLKRGNDFISKWQEKKKKRKRQAIE